MMKKVSQIADEIGVSPQAVYKKIKQHENEMKPYIKKVKGNSTQVNEEGCKLLKKYFKPNIETKVETIYKQVESAVEISYKRQIEELKKENIALKKELEIEREHTRKQSDRVLDIAEQMTELTRNNQILLKQEQENQNLQLTFKSEELLKDCKDSDEKTHKKNFFSNFFREK